MRNIWENLKYYSTQSFLVAAIGSVILPLVLIGLILLLALVVSVIVLWKILIAVVFI